MYILENCFLSNFTDCSVLIDDIRDFQRSETATS